MRYFIPIVIALLAAWYFTTGVRVGLVTFTPTPMFNASGEANYRVRAFEQGKNVGYVGSCQVKSGTATIELFDPNGTRVAGQECVPGQAGAPAKWGINVVTRGNPGFYKARLTYRNFTGTISLDEAHP